MFEKVAVVNYRKYILKIRECSLSIKGGSSGQKVGGQKNRRTLGEGAEKYSNFFFKKVLECPKTCQKSIKFFYFFFGGGWVIF